MIVENTLQMNEKILHQVEQKTEEFYNTFQNVATTIMYSPTVYNYLKADSKERILKKSDLNFVFHNAMEQEEHISSIYLYDSRKQQIAVLEKESGSHLDKLSQMDVELPSKMNFGNLRLSQGGKGWYLIQFPIYDLDSSNYGVLLGMAAFQMDADGLDKLLEDAHATQETGLYLLDGRNYIVASDGVEEQGKMTESMLAESSEYHVQIQKSGIDGWRIVSRIPVKEVYQNADGIEEILFYTFLITAIMMIFLIAFCFTRLIDPIRKIDHFMQNLSKNPEKRLESKRTDEIGTVVRSMNQMLDRIDEANQQQQMSQKKIFEAEIAKKQIQILAYRNQINPHFLYNTFECIRDMALYYEVEDIAEISMALSKVFRFACKAENIVTIQQEVEYIYEYGKIIGYRFMDKIEIEVELEPGVEEKSVIKLLLQPLVENAVFHGLEQTMDGGEVYVHVGFCGEDNLEIRVEDNGCGIPEEQLEQIKGTLSENKKEKGIGIANIYQRLHLFYGEDVVFDIQSKVGEGTKIRIVIPAEIPQKELKFAVPTEG